MIRPAAPDDLPDLLRLIRLLAEYEREPDAVQTTEDDLRRVLFPSEGAPTIGCDVAEADGRVVGLALWFLNFSTWTGRHGIYLEDLVVEEAYRRHGLGKALLQTLARRCVERGYTRLEWWVLDWNRPAWDFYRSIGAEPMTEWTTHRVSGDSLVRLAGLT